MGITICNTVQLALQEETIGSVTFLSLLFSVTCGVKKILARVQVVKSLDLNCLPRMALSLSEVSQIFFEGQFLHSYVGEI
jgi:hypothetical protein